MTDDRSHTVWERLEPLTRNPEMTGTLRGELADPLWLLSRQRQFGEFNGEDAGSPVDVAVDYEHDRVTRVGVGSAELDYDAATDPPLETLVERHPVAAGGDADTEPTHADRAEAGMNLLDRLRRAFPGQNLQPADFVEAVRLDEPEVTDAKGRRHADVLDGVGAGGARTARCLDGHAFYEALVGDGATRPATTVDASQFGDPVTAFHAADGAGFAKNAFVPVAEAFVSWYADLYAEPGTGEDAWDADRMEYSATVSAGAGSDETVFAADEYQGGRLDWYDFSATDGSVREDGDATDDPPVENRIPTKAGFRGMPSSRLWGLEDADVDLASVSAAGDDLSRLFLLEFALVAGDDWFTLPIEAPIGTVTRVTDLTVTDTFGETTTDVPASVDQSDDWELFTFDLPDHPEPGLFLPPVVGTSIAGDPVEDVLFARDEVANLVFGVEEVVEGSLGDPLERAQFRLPTVEVAAVDPAPDELSGQDAADAESIALHNPGDAPLDCAGWTLYAQHSAFDAAPAASNAAVVDLSGVTLPPESTVTVVTGGDEALDTDERVHLERSTPVLASDRVISVTRPDGEGGETLVTVQPVARDRVDAHPAYQLVNEVADHWFPYVQTVDAGQHKFELGLLLDRDALSGGADLVPTPEGTVLDPDAAIYDEEIPRGGRRVTRHYQSTAWLDGSTHVWSSRESRPGVGEVSSGLRFDYLDRHDGENE
jgi:hypothetical protein